MSIQEEHKVRAQQSNKVAVPLQIVNENGVRFSSRGSYEYIRTINITDAIRICEAWNTKQECHSTQHLAICVISHNDVQSSL